MSVYVGIDVHRKRSQVAVVTEDGTVQVNRNVPNGVAPILKVIGGLPSGTPVAFEAAYGWGWLVELPGGLRVRPAPGASVAVQGDRLGPVEGGWLPEEALDSACGLYLNDPTAWLSDPSPPN